VRTPTPRTGVLNKAREDAGKAALNSLRRSNRFKIMVAAGSKGSPLNISQVRDGVMVCRFQCIRPFAKEVYFDDLPSQRLESRL